MANVGAAIDALVENNLPRVFANLDFPDPLSPTRPTRAPGSIVNDTLSSACSAARPVENRTERSLISTIIRSLQNAGAQGVHRSPQPFSKEIDC